MPAASPWFDVGVRRPLPTVIDLGEVRLRPWHPADAVPMAAVVQANLDRLGPWLPWATDEGATPHALATFVDETSRRAAEGSEIVYGIFSPDGAVLGGVGLHDRTGDGSVEIGYWLAREAEGRGLMSRIVAHLTDLALALDGVPRVDIRCDAANERSAAVPRRLGFVLDRIDEGEGPAPADTGRMMVWTRSEPIGATAPG